MFRYGEGYTEEYILIEEKFTCAYWYCPFTFSDNFQSSLDLQLTPRVRVSYFECPDAHDQSDDNWWISLKEGQ